MTGHVLLFGFLALVTFLPIKLAASFTGAGNDSWLAAFLAAVAGPVVGAFAFRVSPGGFPGIMIAFAAGVAAYALVLRVPFRSVIGFAIMVLALQIAVVGAFFSFGVNLQKLAGA